MSSLKWNTEIEKTLKTFDSGITKLPLPYDNFLDIPFEATIKLLWTRFIR